MSQINYYERGLSKAKLEDYEGAIEDFTKAIELNPNDSNAYNKRGFSKIYVDDRSASEDLIKIDEITNQLKKVMKKENL